MVFKLIKFPAKIREQGKVSKVITIPQSISKRLIAGKVYQFSIIEEVFQNVRSKNL